MKTAEQELLEVSEKLMQIAARIEAVAAKIHADEIEDTAHLIRYQVKSNVDKLIN